MQAKLSNGRLKVLPQRIEHKEVDFLHLYVVADCTKNPTLFPVNMDAEAVTEERKRAYGKIDRSKLSKAIWVPRPKYLKGGKQDYQEMEEALCMRYNAGQASTGWLGLGGEYGDVMAPSLSEVAPLILEIISACRNPNMPRV